MDLNQFIKERALGMPTINPDERRAFLGNYRERVAMAVTVRQLHTEKIYQLLDDVLSRYPDYRVMLNGLMPQALINQYMQQALAHDYPFTVFTQPGMRVERRISADDFGWVLADPHAKIERPILI